VRVGESKLGIAGIIATHRATYRNLATGKLRHRDLIELDLPPLAAGGLCLAFNVMLGSTASAGLLTVAGLLSAFLFGLMIQVSDRAENWSDTAPVPGKATSDHAQYLVELAASAGFASMLSIAAAVAFVVASTTSHWALRVSSSIGIALGIYLVLTLMVVMSRVFAVTVDRTRRVRTGADRSQTGLEDQRRSA
jgi:hypothetical protein